MAILPEPLEKLILAFERLPGIGPKTASRLAFYMLRAAGGGVGRPFGCPEGHSRRATGLCQICFNITVAGHDICDICASRERDPHQICVVEDPMDVLAMERTAGFLGRYHVLHGRAFTHRGHWPGQSAYSRIGRTCQGRRYQRDHRSY